MDELSKEEIERVVVDQFKEMGVPESEAVLGGRALASQIIREERRRKRKSLKRFILGLLLAPIILWIALQLVLTYYAPLYALIWVPITVVSLTQLKRF